MTGQTGCITSLGRRRGSRAGLRGAETRPWSPTRRAGPGSPGQQLQALPTVSKSIIDFQVPYAMYDLLTNLPDALHDEHAVLPAEYGGPDTLVQQLHQGGGDGVVVGPGGQGGDDGKDERITR